ncbi:MAG: Uncharacterized protein CEO12_590 [Parcubacteria group bacterium Gr01-1014_46]|nr:MAG: Uncharacterized protein CEO12_590 [Parcubacteria group bacterium Gr01-1014_46]
MTHVSKKEISKENFSKIYNQLVIVFDTAGDDRRSVTLLKEFMTQAEKVMFAKRFAILCMLEEGVSKNFISNILNVSPSTVARISLKYEIGKFKYIENILKKNQKSIWDVLETIVTGGLPPRVGKGRWQWLNEIERKQNRKIFKS